MFQLKYLGVTMVEQPKGEELSAAAVKRIVATVRGRYELFINYGLTRSILLHLMHAHMHRFENHTPGVVQKPTFRDNGCGFLLKMLQLSCVNDVECDF